MKEMVHRVHRRRKHRALPLLVAVWLGLAVSIAAAQQETIAPSNPPQQVVLGSAGDTAHGLAVTWKTDRPAAAPEIMVAPLTAKPTLDSIVRTRAIAQTIETAEGKTSYYYRAAVEGLSPDCGYCYRVGSRDDWSEWFIVRTAAEQPKPFQFIYLSDLQNDIKSLCSRNVRAAYAKAPDARFIVLAGDLVAEGWDDKLWDEWGGALGFISGMVPIFPTPGNHDMHRPASMENPKQVAEVAGPWRARFVLPDNGPENMPSLKGECYFVDYQGLRLISLDANAFANEDFDPNTRDAVCKAQTAWLEKTLSQNPNTWTIVMHHQTVYSVGKDRDYADLRGALVPIYDKYGVDLVLQGHDHFYGRSHKLAGGRIVNPSEPGVVYVASVAGSKMYKKNPKFEPLMAKMRGDTQCFQIISVEPEHLSFKAFAVNGDPVDSFRLSKPKGSKTSTLE